MIETAIIPVAGLATRFLPVSKEVPKALMPVLNKPMIQFAIEEAYFSGIRRILIILGPGQSSIKDYLQNDYATSIKKHISFKNYKGISKMLARIFENFKKKSFSFWIRMKAQNFIADRMNALFREKSWFIPKTYKIHNQFRRSAV